MVWTPKIERINCFVESIIECILPEDEYWNFTERIKTALQPLVNMEEELFLLCTKVL